MICPRCGNQWDATKSPCTRCGLVIRVPGQMGPLGRNSNVTTSPQKSTGGSPTVKPQPQAQPGGPLRPQPQSSGPLGAPHPGSGQPNTWASTRGSTFGSNSSPFPSPAQAPATPRPFNFPSVPVPETPLPSSTPLSGFEQNNVWQRPLPQAQPNLSQAPAQTGTDGLQQRSVPQRPQAASQLGRSTDAPVKDWQRQVNFPRPNRLVTDPLTRDVQRPQGQTPPSYQQNMNSPSVGSGQSFMQDMRQLAPGTILRGGRYRLVEMQGRQEWLSGASESMWIAQDAQRGASQVMICELVLPENGSAVTQSALRTATMTLTAVGRHPHIPTLWDAFSDGGRNFFVFEPVNGESLLSRMRRTGKALQEQDVIESCLQMTEVLELLAQQSPPLVHGLISPEHIMVTRNGSQYVLTNFSIVLAGGATQFVSGIERTHLSVYTSPEFVRGVIDVRSDLYSLLATAYHTVTGSMPASVGGSIAQAQRLNPNVSPQFDHILSKGLRPIASQRYQRPSELRQDLLAIRSVSSTLVPGAGQRSEAPPSLPSQPGSKANQRIDSATHDVPDSLAQAFQALAPSEGKDGQKQLLPRPEDLPPMQQKNDTLQAYLWIAGIIICLLLIVSLTRGFF